MRGLKRGLLLAAALAALAGCGRGLDQIAREEPCVQGVVEELGEGTMLIRVKEGEEELASSDRIVLWLEGAIQDGAPFQAGDEVAVYYDGAIAESYPAQIHRVYAVTRTEG